MNVGDEALDANEEIRVTVSALKDGSTRCRFDIAKGMPFKDAEIAFQRCVQALRWEADNSSSCPFAPVPDRKDILKKRIKLIRKEKLTDAEEVELERLDAQVAMLPTERNPLDQAAMDIIRRAADLIKSRHPQ